MRKFVVLQTHTQQFMKRKILFTFLVILPICMWSQTPNLDENKGGLQLDVDAEGFFFDAEYGTPFAKGYTVTGFRLSPTLVYGINEKAQLRVGFNATLFAGLDSLYMVRPTMTLVYKPTDCLTFIAGTILDNNHHQLAAPVIDPARHIFNYQEDGIQILANTKIWRSDTWLDWTHYLVPWTPDQELFTMGTKHSLELLHLHKTNDAHCVVNPLPDTCMPDKHHDFTVYIPFHFFADHRGGEIKTIDTNTVTTFNENVGLRFEYFFDNGRKMMSNIILDMPVFFYHLENSELDHSGKAFYPSLTYCWSKRNVNSKLSIANSLSYWHGDHYFSAHGSPLFWSANSYSRLHMPASTSYVDADTRNLITYSLFLEHSYKGVSLGFKVDAIHDIELKNNDFIFSFFLRYNGQFKIL